MFCFTPAFWWVKHVVKQLRQNTPKSTNFGNVPNLQQMP